MQDWPAFLVNAVGGAAAIVCLYEGTRRIGAGGASRKAIWMALLGTVYCAAYGGFSLWKHQALSEYARGMYPQVYRAELPVDWGAHLSGVQREASSLALARSAFAETGILRTYFDASGERKPYAPVQADVKRRDRVVTVRAQVEASMRESLVTGWLSLIWGAAIALLGYGVSREATTRHNS